MAAFTEGYSKTYGVAAPNHLGTIISKVIAARMMASDEQRSAAKKAQEQGLSLEDFGITPLQAMASGRPVIAFAGGGALDYVREGETGNLISHQTVDAFMDGIERFGTCKFNYSSIRQFALKFDQSVFEQKIREFVATAMN